MTPPRPPDTPDAHDRELFPPERIALARAAAADAGLDALLVSPGADLRYLTGYQALPLERLTCLVVPAAGDPFLVVPALERAAAEASPAGGLGIEITGFAETDDAYALIARRLPRQRQQVRGRQPHVGREAARLPGRAARRDRRAGR